MLIKNVSFLNKRILIIILFTILLFLLLPLIVPFHVYRNVGILFINATSNIHGFNENTLKENKYYNVTHRFYNPLNIVLNYINSFTVKKDKLEINLSMNDYQKLNYRIHLARKRGQINRADKDVEVNAKILFNKEEFKSKIRLKGTYLDHAVGKRWSFRVKLKNNKTINGMNRFSLHNPITRNGIMESIYHKFLKHHGLMHLEYNFIDLLINGEYIGLYAIEEFMHKNLVEKNKRRDGILLRDHKFLFNERKVLENKKFKQIYEDYTDLLKKYEEKQIKVSDFYDLDKLAKHFAITQIFSGDHSHVTGNVITYYNPLTKKVEVVGYDSNSGDIKINKLQLEKNALYFFRNYFIERLYMDEEFLKKYLFYLIEFSKSIYLETFFKRYKNEIANEIKILHKIKPWHSLDHILNILIKNQNYIKNYLSAYFDNENLINDNLNSFLNDHSISFIDNKNLNYDDDIFINQYGNISSFPFIHFNREEKIATIKSGKYILDYNLIIPKGIDFVISPDTSIFLDNSSSIFSYSNMQLRGLPNKPIEIKSLSNNNSLSILFAEKESNFNYVIFKNLNNNNLNNNLSGSLNFYETNIKINNSLFIKNTKLDDHLNIIRSKFTLSNSKIFGSYSDAIDIDFSDGEIDNISIINSGNDGLDFSNSNVFGKNIFINNSRDKGVSIGENSMIKFSNIKINNSKTGIAIKDESQFSADNITLDNIQFGLALYRKKLMYSPPIGNISNIFFKNVRIKTIIEKQSTLYIDSQKILNYSNKKDILEVH